MIEAVAITTVRPPDSELAPGTLALVEDFRSHLKSHAQSQENLSQMLTSVSATLHALPELARQQGRVLETLMEAAARARQRDQSVERSLVQLSEGAERQTQVLGLVQQQLDLNHETAIHVSDSLRDLSLALGALSSNSERHTRAIEALAETTRKRTDQSDRLEKRLQVWLIVVASIGTAAVLAVMWQANQLRQFTPVAVGGSPAESATGSAGGVAGNTGQNSGTSAATGTDGPAAGALGPTTGVAPVVVEVVPVVEEEPEPLPPPKAVGDAVPDLQAEKAEAEKAAEAKQTPPAPVPASEPATEPAPAPAPATEPATEPAPAPSPAPAQEPAPAPSPAPALEPAPAPAPALEPAPAPAPALEPASSSLQLSAH